MWKKEILSIVVVLFINLLLIYPIVAEDSDDETVTKPGRHTYTYTHQSYFYTCVCPKEQPNCQCIMKKKDLNDEEQNG